MSAQLLGRLRQSRPYICRQCVPQLGHTRRQFAVSKARLNSTKDETNGNVLELLEARGYIKEIAGSVVV